MQIKHTQRSGSCIPGQNVKWDKTICVICVTVSRNRVGENVIVLSNFGNERSLRLKAKEAMQRHYSLFVQVLPYRTTGK